MNSQAFSKVHLKNRAYHQFYALKIIMTTIFTSNTEVRQQEDVVKLCPIMNILYLKSKATQKLFSRMYASSIPDLKDGTKIITKAKLPYLTLILKVFTKEKNTPPDFEPVCEASISEVVFSEDKVKKKLLNLNPLSHLGQAIYIREY